MEVIRDENNPVFVNRADSPRHISLAIGHKRPGEPRYAVLTNSESRFLAYVLLAYAERQEEHIRETYMQASEIKQEYEMRMTEL